MIIRLLPGETLICYPEKEMRKLQEISKKFKSKFNTILMRIDSSEEKKEKDMTADINRR